MNTQPISKLNIAISVLAILLFTCSIVQAEPSDPPLTSKEWVKGYGSAFKMRFSTGADEKYKLHHDGPDSPFVHFVDEMKIYGFTGISLSMASYDYPHGPPSKSKAGYFPTTYNEELGKWRQPDEGIAKVKAMVDAALARGYYVILQTPKLGYGNLKNDKDAERYGWTHEQRLTDNHIQREIDLMEQYAVAFKDYSHKLAFRLSGEIHMWEYETDILQPGHPDYMDEEKFRAKYYQF